MKKALMLGAMVVVAGATTANAKIGKSYQFSGYCDGLTGLKVTSGVMTGYHAYAACGSGYPVVYVGGAVGKAQTYPLVATPGDLGANYTLVYVSDFKTLTWTLYFMSAAYGIPFEDVNGGALAKGYSGARHGGQTTVRAGLSAAGLIGK